MNTNFTLSFHEAAFYFFNQEVKGVENCKEDLINLVHIQSLTRSKEVYVYEFEQPDNDSVGDFKMNYSYVTVHVIFTFSELTIMHN